MGNNITIERYCEDCINRPRVSHKISEYIWNYIWTNSLKPNGILLNNINSYRFFLDFNKYNPEKHKFFFESPYNTNETKFRPEPKFKNIGNNKSVNIRSVSIYLDSNITPSLYADIVYDMFSSFLIINYKKISKEDLDFKKANLDYNFIDRFPYPAPFEEQKYATDEGVINGINQQELYLNYWKNTNYDLP